MCPCASTYTGDLILVVLAWAVLVCIVVLSRRARSIHALQGRPWPTWAGFLTELLTFIAFGGLLHIAIYIHQRFVREDEVDDYIPNNRRTYKQHVCVSARTHPFISPHPTHYTRTSPWPQPCRHDRIQHVIRLPDAQCPTRHHPP